MCYFFLVTLFKSNCKKSSKFRIQWLLLGFITALNITVKILYNRHLYIKMGFVIFNRNLKSINFNQFQFYDLQSPNLLTTEI